MNGITKIFSALILSAVVAGGASAMTPKVAKTGKLSKSEMTHRHKVRKHRRGKLHKKSSVRKDVKNVAGSK